MTCTNTFLQEYKLPNQVQWHPLDEILNLRYLNCVYLLLGFLLVVIVLYNLLVSVWASYGFRRYVTAV